MRIIHWRGYLRKWPWHILSYYCFIAYLEGLRKYRDSRTLNPELSKYERGEQVCRDIH
jgi:hypothetical protein